jgi:hypothetical protein
MIRLVYLYYYERLSLYKSLSSHVHRVLLCSCMVSQGLDYGTYTPYGQASSYASYYGQSYAPYGNGSVSGTASLPSLSPTGLPSLGGVPNSASAVTNSNNVSASTTNFTSTGSYQQLPHASLTSASSSLSGLKIPSTFCLGKVKQQSIN